MRTDLERAFGRRALLVALGSVLPGSAGLAWADEARPGAARLDRARLESRFQELKSRYAAIKATNGKFRPVKPSDPPDLRKARADLGATMASYEQLEKEAASLHGKPGSAGNLGDISDTDSLRLQMAMDRMSQLMETMSNIMKKISATGDAIIQNMK